MSVQNSRCDTEWLIVGFVSQKAWFSAYNTYILKRLAIVLRWGAHKASRPKVDLEGVPRREREAAGEPRNGGQDGEATPHFCKQIVASVLPITRMSISRV